MKLAKLALIAPFFLLAACGAEDNVDLNENDDLIDQPAQIGGSEELQQDTAQDVTATAQMQDADGNDLGLLTLREIGNRVEVSGMLTGLPSGTHAIHIHETGVCEPPFDSAGGHWNPTGNQHGTENPEGPHLGDMPNIDIEDDGTVDVQVETPEGATLRGSNGVLDADGAAVMIHAGADDYQTDPAGDAGSRIACGVVEQA